MTNKQTIKMSISDYTKDQQICDKSGENLVRDMSDICSSFSVKCDGFFGKSK